MATLTLTTPGGATMATTITLTTAAGTATQTLSTGARGPAGASGTGGGTVTVDATVTDGSANAVSGNAVFDALSLKANLASPTFTGTVSGITASMVGLANVTNTSDANKPVSTAQQSALDLKAPLASPSFTTPSLGAATATTINKVTITQPANGATLTIADAGYIITSIGGYITTGEDGFIATGGSINTSGGGGSINTSGIGGGEINTSSESGPGGSILTFGNGGYINTTYGGGSINTSSGGGSIITYGTGSIGLGVAATRTTLTGTATEARAIALPNASGTLALINPSSGTQTFSGSQIFSSTTRPTSSGTGPPAATSLITRDDAAAHAYFSRRLFGNCSGTTGGGGSGATSRRSAASGLFDGDLSTSATSGAFYKINIAAGVGSSSLTGVATSGSVNLSAKWSMFFRVAVQMGTNSHFYLCIGADGVSGVPSSGTSVGMEITSATVARLFRCNAGAAVYSSNATISGITTSVATTDLFFWVDNDGAGNLSLFFAPKLFSASMPAKTATAIVTLPGVASGFTGSDVAMYLRATAASPSVFTSLTMRDVVFTEY